MLTPAVVFVTSVFYRHALNHPVCYTRDLEHEKGMVNFYTLSKCHIEPCEEKQRYRIMVSSWWAVSSVFLFIQRAVRNTTQLLMAAAMLWCALGLYHWRVWIIRSKPATWKFRQIAEGCDDKDLKYIIYQWHCLHCTLQDCQIWSLIEIEWKAHTVHWLVI